MKKYIDYIIKLAEKAAKKGEIPVGAIIVKNDQIIGEGFNSRESSHSILGHAEVNAIEDASNNIQNWNLKGCTLYVTLKPCSMCMEIIKQCRIDKVYYLLDKPDCKHEYNKTKIDFLDSKDCAKEYNEILSNFFANLREKK